MNPLFVYFTKESKWPSLCQTLLLTFSLGLGSFVLSGALLATMPQMLFHIYWLVFGWRLLLFLPVMLLGAWWMAAHVTRQVINSDIYSAWLQNPKMLSPKAAVNGLIFTTLYRLRLLLMLMIILTPLLVAASYKITHNKVVSGCYIFVSTQEYRQEYRSAHELIKLPGDSSCVAPSDPRILWRALRPLADLIHW